MAGLYIHVPFCRKLCRYCDFYSEIAGPGDIDEFLGALAIESSLEASGPFGEFVYDSVYIGGGTPSMLGSEQIEKLFSAMASFAVADAAEITIECNPSSLSPMLLRTYHKLGINRISLGVQSFNDKHLERLGRIHSSKEAIGSFHLIREAGFENISIDLIYGLPAQTLSEWIDDLKQAIDLGPEHISAYNLIIEPETPFGQLYAKGRLRLPSDETQNLMYGALDVHLSKAGYDRYELSNFSKPGLECRHNVKYWHLLPYLGLGPAAVSFDGANRTRNLPALSAYVKATSVLTSPPRETEFLDANKLLSEAIMMQLRLCEGLSCNELMTRFQYDILREKKEQVEQLQRNGYIEIGNGRIRLTRQALFISDEVILKLI
jgi:oxygen-independent coproporphyrinogen-3 oxidase